MILCVWDVRRGLWNVRGLVMLLWFGSKVFGWNLNTEEHTPLKYQHACVGCQLLELCSCGCVCVCHLASVARDEKNTLSKAYHTYQQITPQSVFVSSLLCPLGVCFSLVLLWKHNFSLSIPTHSNTPVLHISAEYNASKSGHECLILVPSIQNRMCASISSSSSSSSSSLQRFCCYVTNSLATAEEPSCRSRRKKMLETVLQMLLL